MAKKTVVSKSVKAQKAETPVEETPVEETPVEEPVVENEETKEGNIITQLLAKFDDVFEANKMAANYHKKVNSDLMELRKQVKSVEKKFNKLEQKSTTKRKNSNNAKKYVIVNDKFQQLIEKNHSELVNKNGEVIIAQPEYNEAGKMLITRTACLQILAAYVNKNNLKCQDNKKKIKMDATLYAILPKFGKKVGKEIESNLLFNNLMKAISSLVESV
jgi:hypothetical protein